MKTTAIVSLGSLALTLALAPPTVAQDGFVVPLHADSSGSTWWAAGPDFKARFDAGATFYPYVGAAASRAETVTWSTVSVAHGRRVLVDPETVRDRAAAGAHRYELRSPGVVERYEVSVDGVEQSFVIDRLRDASGDLVVRGALSGTLVALDAEVDAHAPLRFAAAETPGAEELVRYGRAIAIDANGRRLPLRTRFDRATAAVELRVPQAWLATAEWPVVIDPLLARQELGGSDVPVTQVALAHDDVHDNVLVATVRPGPGGDDDLIVERRESQLAGSSVVVYADFTSDGVREPSVAWIDDAERFGVAMTVDDGASSRVRIWVHDATSTVFNSGFAMNVPKPAGAQDAAPSLAGAEIGPLGYLVFRRDLAPTPQNTETSAVFGVRVDYQWGTFDVIRELSGDPVYGTNIDADRPQIVSNTWFSGWLVVWQQYDHDVVGDAWDILARRIAPAGEVRGTTLIDPLRGAGTHALNPVVAGTDNEWFVAFLVAANDGTKTTATRGFELRVQRLYWLRVAGEQPVLGPVRSVAVAPGEQISLGDGRPFALDRNTQSHAAVVWKRLDHGNLHIARIGDDAGITEVSELAPAPNGGGSIGAPAVEFDKNDYAFLAAWTSAGAAETGVEPVFLRRFEYASDAFQQTLGRGCAGHAVASNSGPRLLPLAGSRNFSIRVSQTRSNGLATLLASPALAPAPIPLPGGNGCELLLDPVGMTSVAMLTTSFFGQGTVPLPLPSDVARGRVFWQFVIMDDDTLWSSGALETVIH